MPYARELSNLGGQHLLDEGGIEQAAVDLQHTTGVLGARRQDIGADLGKA
jgi:hypothetical protein